MSACEVSREFELPEGVVRVEIGYPRVVGVVTTGGSGGAERVRFVSVFLDGERVSQERALELLAALTAREAVA